MSWDEGKCKSNILTKQQRESIARNYLKDYPETGFID
jgi:hypothetical protein